MKDYRKKNGITLQDVCDFMGFAAVETPRRHENGVNFPCPEDIAKYEKLTGGQVVHQDWLDLRARTRKKQREEAA